MKLSNSVHYALIAVVHIAGKASSQPVPNRVICDETKMPERFVLQILRHLVNGGVLIGFRGMNGGYKLAKPANRITLLDIHESVEPFDVVAGVECEALPPVPQRIVINTIEGILADARKRLSSVTVADLKPAKV